jgi:hypothetical protein
MMIAARYQDGNDADALCCMMPTLWSQAAGDLQKPGGFGGFVIR